MSSLRKPCVSDKSWERTSQPLYGFLQTPRTWKDLKSWSRRDDVTRQCLAWLEGLGRIRSFYKEDLLYWTQSLGDQGPRHRSREDRKSHDGDFHPVKAKARHLELQTPVVSKPTVLESSDDTITLEEADQVRFRETGSD